MSTHLANVVIVTGGTLHLFWCEETARLGGPIVYGNSSELGIYDYVLIRWCGENDNHTWKLEKKKAFGWCSCYVVEEWLATESSGIFEWSSLSGSNNRLLNTQLDSYKCPFGTSWQAKKIWKKEKLMETSQNDEVAMKKKLNKTRTRTCKKKLSTY